ncbi:MAG: M15 family metallopeptidase [Acidimicrobiales bacterium]
MPPGAHPAFAWSVATVTAADVPYTWRPGCPVGPAQLRMLTMSFWGFDSQAHTGTMVVNAAVVADVVTVFKTLYDDKFPILSMVPEDHFKGHDPLSMAADNTSGFNCRLAVADGPPEWSVHAYGEAIDVNPAQNPYVFNGVAQPAAGAVYMNRSDVRPGMAYWGGELVDAFASVGWYWGGRWTGGPDYQHFSLTGG